MRFTAIVSGSVDSFDQSSYTSHLAAYLSVPPSTITLDVTAASVRVQTTVVLANAERAAAAASGITALVSSPSAASSALGVGVESVTEPTVSTVVFSGPSQPPPMPIAPPPMPDAPPPQAPPQSPPPSLNATSPLSTGSADALTSTSPLDDSMMFALLVTVAILVLLVICGFAVGCGCWLRSRSKSKAPEPPATPDHRVLALDGPYGSPALSRSLSRVPSQPPSIHSLQSLKERDDSPAPTARSGLESTLPLSSIQNGEWPDYMSPPPDTPSEVEMQREIAELSSRLSHLQRTASTNMSVVSASRSAKQLPLPPRLPPPSAELLQAAQLQQLEALQAMNGQQMQDPGRSVSPESIRLSEPVDAQLPPQLQRWVSNVSASRSAKQLPLPPRLPPPSPELRQLRLPQPSPELLAQVAQQQQLADLWARQAHYIDISDPASPEDLRFSEAYDVSDAGAHGYQHGGWSMRSPYATRPSQMPYANVAMAPPLQSQMPYANVAMAPPLQTYAREAQMNSPREEMHASRAAERYRDAPPSARRQLSARGPPSQPLQQWL